MFVYSVKGKLVVSEAYNFSFYKKYFDRQMTFSFKIIFLLTFVLLFSACNNTAKGCFTYSQTSNLTITFDASCSKNTYFFNWRLDTTETTETTPTFVYKFKKSGTYDVILIAGNKKGQTKGPFSMEQHKVSHIITVN